MPNLTAQQLFTPAPSGVNISNVAATPASGSWLATMLGIGTTIGLSATAWQPGGVARTMMALLAMTQAQQDGLVSLMAQGGFLDWAANGTVTYVNAAGQTVTAFVTPDPSIPSQNPTGTAGWLDELAFAVYNVSRTFATFASGALYFANTSGTSYGPYSPNGFHTANPTTGATFHNTASLTVAPSSVIGTSISAITGLGGLIEIATSTNHGLATGSVVFITGANSSWGVNGFWLVTVVDATHFTLSGSTFAGGAGAVGGAWSAVSTSFAADVGGASSTSAPSTIVQPVTSLVGVSCANLSQFTGANAQSNTTLVALCRAKLATISPNGPAAAYQYFALKAYALLQALATPVTLVGGPITRATPNVNTVTGIVTTTVANGGGAVHGCAQVAITNATNATPIVVTTAAPHGLSPGDIVVITGVTGNTAANGTFTLSSASGSSLTLSSSAGNGAYVNGGIVEGSDLGYVDQILQASVVPNGTIAITQTATNFNVAVVAAVWLPASMVTSAAATLQTVLATYFANLPIGGLTDDSAALAYTNVVLYDAVLELLAEAFPNPAGGSYVQHATLTLNAGTSNLPMTTTQVAVLTPTPVLTVNAI